MAKMAVMPAQPTETAIPNARPDGQQLIRALTSTSPEQNVPEITAQGVQDFTHRLSLALNVCSEQNVKTCGDFIVHSCFPCPRRTFQLMRFLVGYTKSLCPDNVSTTTSSSKDSDLLVGLGVPSLFRKLHPPSPQSQRIHMLRVIDAAVKVRLHQHIPSDKRIKEQIFPFLPVLLCLAAFADSYSADALPGDYVLLQNMVTTWQKVNPADFNNADILRLRAAIVRGHTSASWRAVLNWAEQEEQKQAQLHPFASEPEWILPQRHNNPGHHRGPDHALPAGNGLFMKRFNGWPIKSRGLPEGGYTLYRGGTRADDGLIEQVEQLYNRTVQCYAKHTPEEEVQDVNALGNKISTDQNASSTTHWGWRIDTIAKRKELASRFHSNAVGYAGIQIRPPPAPSRHSSASSRFGPPGGPRNAPRADLRNDIARARGLANKTGSQFRNDGYSSGRPFMHGDGDHGHYSGPQP